MAPPSPLSPVPPEADSAAMDGQALLDRFAQKAQILRQSLGRVVIGQQEAMNLLLVCCLTDSHALLVGPPGVAKTLLVKALASALAWKFSRIQFTPDLMPADVTGYELVGRNENSHAPTMVFRPGPVFANLVLADEINRAAPRTQSALLEAMAERHATIGGVTHLLPDPFLVIATQNPIEQEGTYPLPEAQLDRFMMRIDIGYPTAAQEQAIVQATRGTEIALPAPLLTQEDFANLRALARAVPVAPSVVAYAVKLSAASRPGDATAPLPVQEYVAWGAGPRGSQNLVRAAKVRALLEGRATPTPEDVRAVAHPVLGHRILVNHRALGQGITSAQILDHLLETVPT